MKVTYHVATSSDGFIARLDGDVSWLNDVEIDMSETGLEEFFADVDGLIMGRGTYDFVFNYGSWPYEDKLTWVCTNRELESLEGANLIIAKTVDEIFDDAESRNTKHLWLVGGGKLASSFIEKGRLTHLNISEMPVELGSGIPLFSDHKLEDLSVVKTEVFEKKGFRQIEVVLSN